MEPLFNLREFCKQSVLLEDHLFNPKKHCMDCIRKHLLTMEGLAEEAITLDKDNKHKKLLKTLPDQIRMLTKRVLANEDKHIIATDLRMIRKKMLPHCFNVIE